MMRASYLAQDRSDTQQMRSDNERTKIEVTVLIRHGFSRDRQDWSCTLIPSTDGMSEVQLWTLIMPHDTFSCGESEKRIQGDRFTQGSSGTSAHTGVGDSKDVCATRRGQKRNQDLQASVPRATARLPRDTNDMIKRAVEGSSLSQQPKGVLDSADPS